MRGVRVEDEATVVGVLAVLVERTADLLVGLLPADLTELEPA